MCFSASASFGASAILTGAGIVAIKKTGSPRMLPFASLPVFFGVQQLSEGILWLSLGNPELSAWRTASVYFFLAIAQVIWPVWIPFAVWRMEPDRVRKKIIFYFVLIGGLTSAYITYCLLAYEVSAAIEGRHIRYELYFPNLALRRSLLFLTSVVPIALSSLKWMKLLGGALLGALILTLVFYQHYVISVWCFFAAALSGLVIFIIVRNTQLDHEQGS